MQIWLIALLVLAASAALGAIITYIFCRAHRIPVEEHLRTAQRELNGNSMQLKSIGDRLQKALDTKSIAEQEAKQMPELKDQVAALGVENLELKEIVSKMKKEQEISMETAQCLERAEEHLRETLLASASQVLESNTDEILKHARDQMDTIFKQTSKNWDLQKSEFQTMVRPLEKSLETLDNQVKNMEQKREESHQNLQEKLCQLGQTHEQLQVSTTALIQSMKAPVLRGTWGKVQLRRVVEIAGMTAHVDFNENTTNGDSPDMVVHLPNRLILPVDAKTPMQTYLEALEVSDEQERKAKLDTYPQVMRQRVQELGDHRYRQQFKRTAEIVIMFIPNDACLGIAFEHDPDLLEYALQQGVLIATPVTLVALLKAVAYGWQQQQVIENARQIVLQGKQLYHYLSPLLKNLGGLGRRLDQVVLDYNNVVGSFEGRVLPAARRLRQMGSGSMNLPTVAAVTHHTIPPATLDNDEKMEDNPNPP